MDLSWLPPALFGVLVTFGVTWVQHCWQEKERRRSEKKTRVERRFEEVREFLVSVGELAYQGSMIASWVEHRPSELDRRESLERLKVKTEEVFRSPVAVATGLFAQDERLLGKLFAMLQLIEELYKRAVVCTSAKDRKEVGVLKAGIATLVGEAQELMDTLLDEL